MSSIRYCFERVREATAIYEKSAETEDWLDHVFNNPVGHLWAEVFIKLGWTPNAVTVLSMFVGAAGGVLLYPGKLWMTLIGILLIIWAIILDSTDGQMARMTGKKSQLGRILDGISTGVWMFVVYFVLCLHTMHEPIPFSDGALWGWRIWIVAAASGIFGNSFQCMLADYFRNIHLFFLNVSNELDSSADVRAELKEAKRNRDTGKVLYLSFYAVYTRIQELATPQIQKLIKAARNGEVGEEARETYLAASRKMIPLCNLCTINTRTIALFLCVLLKKPVLYFAFELIVLTILMLGTLFHYENVACRLTNHRKNKQKN